MLLHKPLKIWAQNEKGKILWNISVIKQNRPWKEPLIYHLPVCGSAQGLLLYNKVFTNNWFYLNPLITSGKRNAIYTKFCMWTYNAKMLIPHWLVFKHNVIPNCSQRCYTSSLNFLFAIQILVIPCYKLWQKSNPWVLSKCILAHKLSIKSLFQIVIFYNSPAKWAEMNQHTGRCYLSHDFRFNSNSHLS